MDGANETAAEAQPEWRGHRLRNGIIAAVVVVLVAVGAFVGYSVYSGDIAPSDAAAKYSGFNYLPEAEVTDYIGLYREQMGLADATDEDWATFLAAYNLTPARLRYTTINQILKDRLVQAKADELGLSASEEEIDASIDTLRDSLGLGSDDILDQTLASHGQTREGLREVYRQGIVQRLVLSAEVPTPDVTDGEVKEFMETYDSELADPVVKHTYCFKIFDTGEEGARTAITQAQQVRMQFVNGERTPEAFAALVKQYSNDDELVESNGANGWNADTSAYSEAYLDTLSGLGQGDVSTVFADGDAYEFIWVSDEFALPTDSDAIAALDPSGVPASLWQFLSDSAAYEKWEEAGQEYLDQLLEQADVVYYPMPADVPYNVDMSLANLQLEEIDDSGESGESNDAPTALP